MPGSDAASIAESEGFRRVPRIGPQMRDQLVMCSARAFQPPGSGWSRRWSAGSSPSALTAAVTAPKAGSRQTGRPGSGPGGLTSAPGYFRMLTARATISATVTMEMADCRAMASFAQRDSGSTSVGLNAEALVNAR